MGRSGMNAGMAGMLAAAIVACCTPATVMATDLMEAYRLAQANDPAFEAARHTFDAAKEKLPQALAGLLPTMTASANQNHTDSRAKFTGTSLIHRGIHAWTWNVQLTQPLFRLQSWMAYSESEALVAQAQAEYSKVEQDLILRLSQAYFDILVAQESVRAAESRWQSMEEQGKAAKRSYELGTASVTDSYEARSKAELARSEFVVSRNELEIKLTELEKLTGKTLARLASLKPMVAVPRLEPNDSKAWIEQARENNPEVRMQEAAVKVADSSVGKERAANAGTIDFVASYGANYSSGNITIPSDYETRAKSAIAGVQVNIPIFAGGLNSSRIREALANKYKADASLEEAKRKAGADAKQAYAGIVNGLSRIEALKMAVEAAENSLKGNQVGYRMGLRINNDVLDAEQQLYVSRRDLVKARYETIMQGLKLKAAAGVLTEKDIEAIDEILDK